jgi:hypothetical protein
VTVSAIFVVSFPDYTKARNDDYPPSEATQTRDAALRAALSMPTIPHAELIRKAKKKAGSEAPQS